MEISVIIPTYRPADYLFECLASLQKQTLAKEKFEILLVLNGCDEPYKSTVEEYLAAHLTGMNIRFIHLLEPGVSNARNKAIDEAQGKYVAFIDDDDYVSDTYLAKLLDKASPSSVVLSNTLAFRDRDGYVFRPFRITWAYDKCVRKGYSSLSRTKKFFSGPCMKLIPREIIAERRFDLRFRNGEDSIFMFLISDRIDEVRFTTPDAVYFRRFREGSAVTTTQPLSYRMHNAYMRIKEYTKIYLSAPCMYSMVFYLTRIIATVKGVLLPQKS